MSRVIVKNLPKDIKEEKIRKLFGEHGLITDVQLKYTKDGVFRQFAFIGFREENEADRAIEHLHNSCVKTSKISVERCAALGDSTKPKSWSKHAADSSYNQKKNPKEPKPPPALAVDVNAESLDILKKYKDDPMFDEFIKLHGSKQVQELVSKSRMEEEEESGKGGSDSGKDSEISDFEEAKDDPDDGEDDEEKIANKPISDMEYMKMLKTTKPRQKMEKKVKEKIDLFVVKLRELPYNCKKKDLKHFFKPIVPYSIRLPRNIKSIAYVGFKEEKQFKKALLKDKSIINGKQVSVQKYINKNAAETEEGKSKNPKWKTQEESLKNEEDIAESGRIFVRNLSYTTTDEDFQQLFEKFGPIADISLPIDFTTRKMKGFGVVTFLLPEHAVKAYAELDGTILHGRMLHLLPGKPKDNADDAEDDSTNYKKKKAKEQKKLAGSSHNWNSLFLGHNAVADVIASTYGTTKEQVLGPHGKGSGAVRLALGETQIVATTRKYLEEQGVVLDAFSNPTSKRSKTVILVKNLPAGTEMKELNQLFKVHGIVNRVILPPSGITALVEFVEASEAKKAFTKLAYSKFKSLPLYLEWAPEGGLQARSIANKSQQSEAPVKETEETAQEEEKDQEDEEEEPEPDTTLFVKNLHFKTTDEDFKKHFEGCGKVHYATVATKKDKSNPDHKLSMGYGFVRFYHKISTDKALKTLQQSELDGKSLELKRSERTLQNEVQTTRKTSKMSKQTGTKILIRNIPFQANRNEIMELFQTFGEIKALRLPKKMNAGSTNSHRGFGFVDFTTNSDAKKAFEALSQSTHLYGRRLVLEWASTEEGVEEIRKRTAEHFHEDTEVRSKKGVFDMDK